MITYIKGDIFNSPAQVLVNTVNTVGVMGKGIALEFKNRYPEMYGLYKEKCDEKSFNIGNLLLWKKDSKWILLFPTKNHWRENSKISYIEEGLKKLVESYDELGIESIAFPKLGCGNGGLNWKDVKTVMEKYLKNLPIHIYIYLDKYDTGELPEKNLLEMDTWLKKNTELIGFNFLKKELQKSLLENNKLFINDPKLKEISWIEDTIHIYNGEGIVIHEDELCDFWKYVKNVGVIDREALPSRFSKNGPLMLEILKKIDYIQPVLLINDGLNMQDFAKGYQYISS